MADTAAGLLDAIAANDDGIERTQSETVVLNQQALTTMTSLGVPIPASAVRKDEERMSTLILNLLDGRSR